jgi:hypothetical protein
MKKIFSALLLGGLVSFVFTSCTSLTEESWTNPDFKDRKLGKTMVMGIADSKGLTVQYEAMFVNGLTTYGISAHSMHAEFPQIEPHEKEKIISLLKTNQFSSILVTRLLSADDRQRQAMGSFVPTLDGDSWGNVQVYVFTPNTSYMQNLMEYVLETNLYDVHSKQLIWSGRKSVYDDSSDLKNMKKVIRSVMEELRSNKMLTD